ncbi:MAG: methionine synthase [Methanoculleaceae archaeon]
MTISGRLLPTTVVGSYPVVRERSGTLSHLRNLFDDLKTAREIAVDDQLAAGIDIISDGQVRGDMIHSFTEHLPGIRGDRVVGKILPPSSPITVGDVKYALSRHGKVKGIITGPSTIAHALRIETPVYRNREDLILDLGVALSQEARHLEKAGVMIIQIDEPIFSTGAADLPVGRQAVNTIISVVDIPTALHCCGSLESVIDDILPIGVDVLDFEFAGSPENLELLSERDLRGRMVGFGCVNTADTAVETVEEIARRIRRGVDVLGAGNLLVDPDCGMRMFDRDTAFAKLSHMVEATRRIREGLA